MTGTILFLVFNDSYISRDNIEYVIEDFLEEEYNTLSHRELNELKRIKEEPERITRSRLFDKIKYYTLPFLED